MYVFGWCIILSEVSYSMAGISNASMKMWKSCFCFDAWALNQYSTITKIEVIYETSEDFFSHGDSYPISQNRTFEVITNLAQNNPFK